MDARFPFPSINPVQHLEIAAIPVRIHVIGNGGPAMFNRQAKRLDHCPVQLRDPRGA
jgi:hypothetical protein